MREDERGEGKSQPTYVLAPGYYPPYEQPEDQVRLADYISVLWRRKTLIVAGTLVCASLAFLASLLMDKAYRATATLILLPPRFSTELRPQPLSVETYQSILESDHITQQLKETLLERKALQPGESLGSLETQIYTGREHNQPYKPLIDLIVEAGSPEKAATVANVWADVFVTESTDLAYKGKQGTLEFIEAEYPVTKERLKELEAWLKSVQDGYDQKIKVSEDLWDDKVAAFRAEWNIESLRGQLAALERELAGTVRSDGFGSEKTKKAERDAKEEKSQKVERVGVIAIEDGLISKLYHLQLEIQRTKETLDQLKKEIQSHPQFIVVSKAITDDALWDRIGRDPSGETSKELERLKLNAQELNPVYQSLLQRLADTQVAYDSLIPQEEHLKKQIELRKKEIAQLNRLILDKELELQKLERGKEVALSQLMRERDYKVNELMREVESSKTTFKTLSEKYEAARLAKTEEDQDVKIGAYAVPSSSQVKPKPLLNTGIAFIVGLMMMTMLAFLVEYVQASNELEPKPSQINDSPDRKALEPDSRLELRKRA